LTGSISGSGSIVCRFWRPNFIAAHRTTPRRQANRPPVAPVLDIPSRLNSRGDLHSAACSIRCGRLRFGGDMLFKIALALLGVWLLGVLGVYTIGDLVHVLLLVGLMLLLLAFLRARDAAVRRAIGGRRE
jgi:hypothetical protein